MLWEIVRIDEDNMVRLQNVLGILYFSASIDLVYTIRIFTKSFTVMLVCMDGLVSSRFIGKAFYVDTLLKICAL